MLIDMLPHIKPPILPLPVQKCRDGKCPTDGGKLSLSGITREMVVFRTEATIEAWKVMPLTTVKRKFWWKAMEILERSVDGLIQQVVSIDDSK